MLSYYELPDEPYEPPVHKYIMKRETNIDVMHLLLIFMIAIFFITI